MKISLNWLKDFVKIPHTLTAEEFGRLFTTRTAEVENVESEAESFKNMVIGKIEKISPHPDANKLQVTKTNVGNKTLQIVCGAPNIKKGMLVPVALIGAKVRWHGEGDPVTLEKAKIRGVESHGMICAGEEIGIESDPDGITDLSHLKVDPGTPLAEALNKNDTILTVDNKSITHRPDLWGHYGIARETAALLNEKLTPLKPNVKYQKNDSALSVEIKNKKLCPRYIGVLMENVKIEASPAWMQKRLETVGYRPINNIVDATNYVMAELGQPMHAFDANKIEGGIVVRTAKDGEKIQTLDGAARKLTKDMLVIADRANPIAIAGVMGGAPSEINEKTTRIILESANFNPSSVRKTSTKLALRTEAVQRFEKNLDPNLSEQAMDQLCQLILKICPEAKIVSSKIDQKYFDDTAITTIVDMNKVRAKIGKEIPTKEAIRILGSLEFKINTLNNATQKNKDILEVEIPSFRATKDVEIEDDIVEEIARMHGYENIEPVLPDLPARLPEENIERILKHRARQLLAYGMDFTEVYNYSFYSLNDIKKTLLPKEIHEKVDNYLSEEQTHMRVSLVPNMLKNVAENLKSYNRFKIFEIGRTYEDLQEYFPKEQKKLCGIVVEQKKYKQEIFYDAKGYLEKFFSYYNTASFEIKKGKSLCPHAHPNKYAAYFDKATGKEIARVFEIHPLVAKNYEIENAKIGIFEINFTLLATKGFKQTKYTPLAKYPEINFDVSVLIEKTQTIDKLFKAIQKADRELITNIELFDLYEGPNIKENQKAAAFTITLRADDRTLTDKDMKYIQQQIFKNLQNLGGEIRGL